MQQNLETIIAGLEDELITTVIGNIKAESISFDIKDKLKLAFFVKQELDSFLSDIIEGLSEEYETKKIITTEYKQIEEGMQWADICWFEWCDELVAYGSKLELAKEKKIICRLHRYEAFTDYIKNVEWSNVNKLIFVSEHIRDIVISKIKIQQEKCEVVYNGINLDKFKFYKRQKGFNLAWIGYLNLRKNPMIILQYMNELVKIDKKYKLFIAGSFQDETLYYYVNDMINKLGLENNIQFDGFIQNNNISKWLEDKNYIVTGSIAEGHPVGIMEAMASGLKPVLHYFPGIEKFYPKRYIYYDLDDFKKIVNQSIYDSNEYRKFIEDNYSLNKQMVIVKDTLKSLDDNNKKTIKGEDLRGRFLINSDDNKNTEKFFDYLLESNMESEYMKYLAQWFIRSKYDLTYRFNYYYGNMYRNFTSYSRFKHIEQSAYEEMEKIGEIFLDKYYTIYFNKSNKINKKKILFILNGLDINQSVTQFFMNYLKASNNMNCEYSVMSLLNKNEFSNSQESINYFDKLNENLFVPISNKIEEKIKEFYNYISVNNFEYVVYQSLYYAPIGVLLYPLLKKVCKVVGKIQFQQPEKYFDKKLDFVYTYMKKDNCCKNIFDLISPINTELVDENFNIRTLLSTDSKKKIVVSIGRAIKYKNNGFWNFVIDLINQVEDICFVVFGCDYSDFTEYIPRKLVKENKVYFAGFNLHASAYLKSCDYYLNSYPGGGYSVEEAYYAKLPIITFYEEEENGERYDAMVGSYMATAYLYNEAENIFPKTGDFDGLLSFSKKIIKDNNFKNYVTEHRKINISNLSFQYFVNEFVKYINSLANKKWGK